MDVVNMVSDIQLRANQKNAKLGGVKTEEGKQVSKYNALKHGVLRQSLTAYEEDFYIGINDDLVTQYQPVGIIESILIERIAIYYLKLFRLQKAETEYLKQVLDPRVVEATGFPNILEAMMKNEVVNEGYVAKITDDNIQRLTDVFSRYEITIENRLYKAIHELERAIALRKGLSPPPTLNILQVGSFGENT